jgi:hypothetical protein
VSIHVTCSSCFVRNTCKAYFTNGFRFDSIVENEGFRNMIHVLEPRYEIPSRPYFSNVVVPKIYQDIRAKVESDLKMATSL